MKAVVLLSKKFFPAHFRAGEATEFKTKEDALTFAVIQFTTFRY